MKTNLFFLLALLVTSITACDKDEAILEDIAGNWEIVAVTVTLQNGDFFDTAPLAGARLDFANCDGDQNDSSERCDLAARDATGDLDLALKFNVLRSPGAGERVVQVSGSADNTVEEEQTLLHDVITRTFTQTVSGNQLTLTTNRSLSGVPLQGQDIEEIVITARRP